MQFRELTYWQDATVPVPVNLLKGRAAEWYRLLKDGPSIGWEEIVSLFYSKFYPPSEIHKDRNQIYNFWPHDGESIA
jgi:hypothetical protein